MSLIQTIQTKTCLQEFSVNTYQRNFAIIKSTVFYNIITSFEKNVLYFSLNNDNK